MEKIKNLYLSDIHLGCKENNAFEALKILDLYDFEKLFLVGDILDIKELKKIKKLNSIEIAFIKKVLDTSKKKKVIYIQGNHERDFFQTFEYHNISFCKEYIENGKLIIHGDLFDNIIGRWKFLYSIGSIGYDLSINFDEKITFCKKKLGFKKSSKLSKFLKKIVKNSVNYLSDFHNTAISYAKYKNCNIIICGHTHQQEIFAKDQVTYINCGDLRQDMTYVIEKLNGDFELKNHESNSSRQ